MFLTIVVSVTFALASGENVMKFPSLQFGIFHDCTSGGETSPGLHVSNVTYTPTTLSAGSMFQVTGGKVKNTLKDGDGFTNGHLHIEMAIATNLSDPLVNVTQNATCNNILELLPESARKNSLFPFGCPGLLQKNFALDLRFINKYLKYPLPSKDFFFVPGGNYYAKISLVDISNVTPFTYFCLEADVAISNPDFNLNI